MAAARISSSLAPSSVARLNLPIPALAAERPAVLRSVAALREMVAGWRQSGRSIGLVPTMGALHEGHLALIRRALQVTDQVVVSIFVNPTQFGPNEDFAAYPRREADDLAELRQIGAHVLYAPAVAEIYPDGFATTIHVGGSLTAGLCAPHRPGHFDGVATVVGKLLTQVAPDAAFFGEKDYQQLQVIRCLVRDLNLPVQIHGVPTIREADGLARSSRNAYLTTAERRLAANLPAILGEAASAIAQGGGVAPALRAATERLLSAGFSQVDYVELADAASLEPLRELQHPARLLAAAWLGRTRLIDNLAVDLA